MTWFACGVGVFTFILAAAALRAAYNARALEDDLDRVLVQVIDLRRDLAKLAGRVGAIEAAPSHPIARPVVVNPADVADGFDPEWEQAVRDALRSIDDQVA